MAAGLRFVVGVMTGQPLIRVIDDEEGVRTALSFMLTSEGFRVKTYESAQTFLVDDTPSEPGCIIADVRMPGMSGIELFDELRARSYPVPLLFLSGHGDIDMAVSAVLHGAVDFVTKPVVPKRLLSAVANALDKDRHARAGWGVPTNASARWNILTDREQEIVNLIIAGRINREVADDLHISVRTVEGHRATAFKKLGVKTPEEAANLKKQAEGELSPISPSSLS